MPAVLTSISDGAPRPLAPGQCSETEPLDLPGLRKAQTSVPLLASSGLGKHPQDTAGACVCGTQVHSKRVAFITLLQPQADNKGPQDCVLRLSAWLVHPSAGRILEVSISSSMHMDTVSGLAPVSGRDPSPVRQTTSLLQDCCALPLL